MTPLGKFQSIIDWFADVTDGKADTLVPQEDVDRLAQIEGLMEEPFPDELRSLYEMYDGGTGGTHRPFVGHGLNSLTGITSNLEFSHTLIKPANPVVENAHLSNEIIDALVDVFKSAIPERKVLGLFEKRWHKLETACSPNSLSGPYFYERADTSDEVRSIPSLSNEKKDRVFQLAQQLSDLERKSYNWDELNLTIYGDGRVHVERTFYDFDNELDITSFPANAIKQRYFHYKWLPVIDDGGGNFIGIDLDPGPAGRKGQVIAFGRDDTDMFVLAPSWDEFLDLVLEKIAEGGEAFKRGEHLHDYFREELVSE